MDSIANRRGASRQRVLKSGKIVLNRNWSVLDCVIRDISATGARLRCGHQQSVPDEFRLVMLTENTIRDVRVVWRHENDLGVRFTGEAERAPPRKW